MKNTAIGNGINQKELEVNQQFLYFSKNNISIKNKIIT